jgi:hypothetical protein
LKDIQNQSNNSPKELLLRMCQAKKTFLTIRESGVGRTILLQPGRAGHNGYEFKHGIPNFVVDIHRTFLQTVKKKEKTPVTDM